MCSILNYQYYYDHYHFYNNNNNNNNNNHDQYVSGAGFSGGVQPARCSTVCLRGIAWNRFMVECTIGSGSHLHGEPQRNRILERHEAAVCHFVPYKRRLICS